MSNQEIDEIDLGEFFQAILAGWKIILLCVVTAVIAGAIFTLVIQEERYQAQAEVRVLPQIFCPPAAVRETSRVWIVVEATTAATTAECDVSLPMAIGQASESVSSPATRHYLSAQLASALETEISDLSANPSLTLRTAESSIALTVQESRGDVAIAFANLAAEALTEQLNGLGRHNLEMIALDLEQRLASLPRPDGMNGEVAVALIMERATLEGRLGTIQSLMDDDRNAALVSSYAAPPVANEVTQTNMNLFLFSFVGMLFGCVLALANTARRGVLHGARAISRAFEIPTVVRLSARSQNSSSNKSIWQQLRVAAGDPDTGVIAIGGLVSDDLMKQTCLELYKEFERGGKDIALLDLANVLSDSQAANAGGEVLVKIGSPQGIQTFASTIAETAIAELLKHYQIVIVATPSAQSDLPLMHRAFRASTARILIVKTGLLTREVVGKILLAEKDVNGKRVLFLG